MMSGKNSSNAKGMVKNGQEPGKGVRTALCAAAGL